jgi:hypothetical protein
MKYRHERMMRAREAREQERRQQAVEAVLRASLTENEAQRWRQLSEAVGQARRP